MGYRHGVSRNRLGQSEPKRTTLQETAAAAWPAAPSASHLMRILLVVFTVPIIAQIVVRHPIGRSLPMSPGNAPPALLDWGILGLCAIGGYGLSQAVRFQAGLMIFRCS
jgi:uncharacterized membrane protein AbrB (regulator of aidB expression)